MDKIIKKLVDIGVLIKTGEKYYLNDGNYYLTVYENSKNHDIIQIYQTGDDYIAVTDMGYDDAPLRVTLSESNMLLLKKLDLHNL